ncbi:MAG TPA: hypothetical protein VF902_07430 [Coriobacteriia bacterium]
MTRQWNDPFRKNSDPKAVVGRHRGRLMDIDAVVSVGLAFGEGHRHVIVVGVASEEAVASVELPAELDGVPVEVRVVGALSTSEGEPGGAEPDSGTT